LSTLALLGCRACGARPPRGAELKLCTGCDSVAFCDAACQAADWRRHKRFCGRERSAEAALADAMCAFCLLPLLPNGDAAAEQAGVDADAQGLIRMARCRHLTHEACLAAGSCRLCTQ
jgi:hypothetical protein